MLLRQLYMAHYETRRFRRALETARQALELRVMSDVLHQDAARAAQALGLVDDALGHLRLASRCGPASRRAFHLWTLGSVLFLAGRYREAIGALERAARWGTTDKPLYHAQVALVRLTKGEKVPKLSGIYRRLSEAACGHGYGRFVLGHLAFYLKREEQAKSHLQAFVERTTAGRPALVLSLAGEIELAKRTLALMEGEVAPSLSVLSALYGMKRSR
jgi:tetratricopeptide (TPR) repeat protein